jgi:tRNA nucleotidyltransferase/poly(A) polymerase
MDLSRKILSDPINKWFFSQSNKDTYLVGGYLRDLLRGRVSKDIDFVVKGDAEGIALKAAQRFNGRFVILKKGLTCRIVLKDESVIDINFLTEPITEDLLRRDFTVNATAWSPEAGLLDPTGGLSDIKRRLIKTVRPQNLKDDPLRLLRAYRLSAELGFTINNETRSFIKNHSNLIKRPASERITEEFIRILNHHDAGRYLKLCSGDGLLTMVLNIDSDRLSANLNLVKRFDSLNKGLRLYKHLNGFEKSQGLTAAGLVRLAALYNGSEGFNGLNNMLKLSRANTMALAKTLSAIYRARSCRVTKRTRYSIFKEAEERSIEAAIILSIVKRRDTKALIKEARRFLSIRRRPLLTGDEVQKILGTGPGRKIGDILHQLEEERFCGNIASKAESKSWIVSNFT